MIDAPAGWAVTRRQGEIAHAQDCSIPSRRSSGMNDRISSMSAARPPFSPTQSARPRAERLLAALALALALATCPSDAAPPQRRDADDVLRTRADPERHRLWVLTADYVAI